MSSLFSLSVWKSETLFLEQFLLTSCFVCFIFGIGYWIWLAEYNHQVTVISSFKMKTPFLILFPLYVAANSLSFPPPHLSFMTAASLIR